MEASEGAPAEDMEENEKEKERQEEAALEEVHPLDPGPWTLDPGP